MVARFGHFREPELMLFSNDASANPEAAIEGTQAWNSSLRRLQS